MVSAFLLAGWFTAVKQILPVCEKEWNLIHKENIGRQEDFLVEFQ
jgi:hypothetical protein